MARDRRKVVALDIEGPLVSKRRPLVPHVCIAFAASETRTALFHRTDPEGKRTFREVLQNRNVVIVGAKIVFDLTCLAYEWPDLSDLIFKAVDEDRVRDILINEAMIDVAFGQRQKRYSLGTVARKRSGIILDKTDESPRKHYGDLWDVPCEDWDRTARDYAVKDVIAPWCVDADQQKQHGDLLGWQYERLKFSFGIYLQRTRGIRIDRDYVDALDEKLEQQYIEVSRKLMRQGFLWGVGKSGRRTKRTGTKNTKAIKAWVCEHVEHHRIKLAPQARDAVRDGSMSRKEAIAKGMIALDHEAVLEYGHPELYQHRNIELMRSRVIMGFQADVVRTHYEDYVDSGRVSSADPQLHNLPRSGGYREAMIPRKGYIFVACDLSGIELCCIAQVCINLFGWSRMAEVINAGKKPHTMLAAQLLGWSYDELDEAKRAGDPEAVDAYNCAKPGNFGFLVRMSAEKFQNYAKNQYGIMITLERARELREAFDETWPEIVKYGEWCGRKVGGYGKKATAIQPYSGRVRGGCSFTEFANTHFQGYAADGFGMIQWELAKAAYVEGYDPEFFGAYPVHNVHDESLIESPIRIVDRVQRATERIFVETFQPITPDVKISCESKQLERYTKA